MEPFEYEKMFYFEEFYWWYLGLFDLVEKTLLNYLPKNSLILDAGCGTGKLCQILSKYFYIIGFDYSEIAIKLAKKRNVNCFVQDLNFWNPNKNSYDAIISLDVLCEKGINDDFQILKKFFYALKKNGILILNLPAFKILRRSHDIFVHIKHRYTKKELKNKLIKIGFNIELITYRLPHLFFIILLKKVFEKQQQTSDLKKLPKFLNNFLLQLNKLENFLIRNKIKFPIGSSVFVVAKK